jgi:hypothetical protein
VSVRLPFHFTSDITDRIVNKYRESTLTDSRRISCRSLSSNKHISQSQFKSNFIKFSLKETELSHENIDNGYAIYTSTFYFKHT